jgi:hypothetical protein
MATSVTPTLSSPAQNFPVLDERKAKFCFEMKEAIMMLQVYRFTLDAFIFRSPRRGKNVM